LTSQRAIRVVALTPYPVEGASTRFRVTQFIEPLRGFGVELEVFPFYSTSTLSVLYGAGQAIGKSKVLASALRRRRALLKTIEEWPVMLGKWIKNVFN